MNLTKQALGLILSIILLAYCGWYFAHLNSLPLLDNDTLATTVDTTITDLTVRQFTTQGLIANKLTTPLLEHIPQENIHLLKTPHIIIAQEAQPAWDIRSLKAKSFAGGKWIVFSEHVVVHQQADKQTQESTFKTEEVTYYPQEKKATTKLLVTFEQPGNTVQSTGMNAYLAEKRVELLHGAHGSYDPTVKG